MQRVGPSSARISIRLFRSSQYASGSGLDACLGLAQIAARSATGEQARSDPFYRIMGHAHRLGEQGLLNILSCGINE